MYTKPEHISDISGIQASDMRGLRIAIASNSPRQRNQLQQMFERSGLRVRLNEAFTLRFVDKLAESDADVLLLDVDETAPQYDELLDKLLESDGIPIIFNDVSGLTLNEPQADARWFGTLMRKIAETTGRPDWSAPDLDLAMPVSKPALEAPGELARNVWVLGASLGGPDAVKHFLSALPAEIPAGFILAQHLGSNFDTLLAEQLDRYTPLRVIPARAGHTLHHGEVIVAPVTQRMQINPLGVIELYPIEIPSFYTPSIDTVLTDMANRYRGRTGCIIFSGMCDDGVLGVRVVHAMGGPVWTQDPASCVISAMPDNVLKTGTSSFTGTPARLADKLIKYLQEQQRA